MAIIQLEQGKPEMQIQHGDDIMTPDYAVYILDNFWFEWQTKRMNRGSAHVARFTQAIKRGQWRDFSQIHFAQLPDGKMFLMDGYHRLQSIANCDSNTAVMVNIIITQCADMQEVKKLYASFDRPGETRIRTNSQVLNAFEFSEAIGVQKKVAEAAFRAIPIIMNNLRVVTRADEPRMASVMFFDDRFAETLKFKTQIKEINEALHDGDSKVKQKLLGTGIMAVMMVTFKYHPDIAFAFWSRVCKNTGLNRGEPEHTLANLLLTGDFGTRERKMRGVGNNNMLIGAAALAWNAAFEGKKLVSLKPGSVKVFTLSGIGKYTHFTEKGQAEIDGLKQDELF